MESRAIAKKRYEKTKEAVKELRNSSLERFEDLGQADEYIALLDAEELQPNQRRFLGAYAMIGIVTAACRAVGISQRVIYNWRKDATFEAYYIEAYKLANDRLELEALRLSTGFYEKPVVSMGEVVAYEQIFDTRLLLQLLKARNPDKFGTKIDVTSNGQSLVKLVDRDAWNSV